MSLFRKLFYRKPPDGLLEIAENIYVFDCCFSTDPMDGSRYKNYISGTMGQLREHFPDASFMVFNFKGERQSQISDIVLEYNMTVMDYPRHYEGCPLLSMEMLHHFLRSCESWLLLSQQNMILMHCEQGGWPVCAFMLAGLLIYRRQYSGEQRTLDMIYKQAPRELLQLLTPLNPMPSQLRYLQYISRRNVSSEWPPLHRALTLDCIILRTVPNFDGEGGCCPIFRVYGQDPFIPNNRISKMLHSTPKKNKNVRLYKQADCELVKIDIHCHIQGDVVLECINLDEDLEAEEMVFRLMFNTGFIRSNILMLNRDEIDIMWSYRDRFSKDFRAEVLFSEMDAAASVIAADPAGLEEKEGLPVEAFAKVHEIFSSADWLGVKGDAALSMLQQLSEKLEIGSPLPVETNTSLPGSPHPVVGKSITPFENIIMAKKPIASSLKPSPESHQTEQNVQAQEALSSVKTDTGYVESSPDLDLIEQNVQAQEVLDVFPLSSPSKTISKQISHPSLSNSSPSADYLPTSETTALLQVQDVSRSMDSSTPSTLSEPCSFGSEISSSTSSMRDPTILTSQTEPPPPPLLSPSPSASKQSPPVPPVPPLHPGMSSTARGRLLSVFPTQPPPPRSPPPPPPPPSHPPTSPPPPSRLGEIVSSPVSTIGKSSSATSGAVLTCLPTSASSPSPPPPPSCLHSGLQRSASNSLVPLPPPPLPVFASKELGSFVPSPPPPPPIFGSKELGGSVPSPPPPPPPIFASKQLGGSVPLPPPPPPIFASKELGGSASQPIASPIPPPPPPLLGVLTSSAHDVSKAFSADCKGEPGEGTASMSQFGKKVRLSMRSTSPRKLLSVNATSKRASLKPLHWVKVTRAMQGSLWAESPKNSETIKAPEIDMSELESLFSVVGPKSGGKSSRRASLGSKPEKVQLIDLRRANNCEIMLTKVKMPLPDLLSSVFALDDSFLDIDQVENLIKFCPTKEEMELLQGYKGDKENLGRCEQYFLELMKVPRVESKLGVFSFKIHFKSQVSDLRNSLNTVHYATKEIRKSFKFKGIMQTILNLGNALNRGTSRGSAVGFRLDSLLKLCDTRARNNKMTLMHYLCKMLAEKLPELLDFHKDFVSLEAASKIQLKIVAEEMQAVNKGLENVEQELTEAENDGPISESEDFCKTLRDFLSGAEAEVRSLTSLYSAVGRNTDALAVYFGEDPARCSFEQVATTLYDFVKMFQRAHEENCKQLELERRKAQKEAEIEKLKMGSPKMQSEEALNSLELEKRKAQMVAEIDNLNMGALKKRSEETLNSLELETKKAQNELEIEKLKLDSLELGKRHSGGGRN